MNGEGIIIEGKAYAWTDRIDATVLALTHVRRIIARMIDVGSLLLTLAILGLFFLHALEDGLEAWLAKDYWLDPSTQGFFASLFLVCACFVFFRFKSRTIDHVRMPKWNASEPPSITDVSKAKKINIATFFSKGATHAIEQAHGLASRYGHAHVDPLHLFLGAVSDAEVGVIFGRLNIQFAEVKDALTRKLQTREVGGHTEFSDAGERVLLIAFSSALLQRRPHVSAVEIFFAAYTADAFLKELFYDKQVKEDQVENVVAWVRITERLRERYDVYRHSASHKPTGAMNRAMTSVETKFLDSVSEDLTTAAVEGRLPMLIGREHELDAVFRAIEGGRQSVVLVGPDGVGKSAIIAGVAERMVEERVPDILKDKRLVAISIPFLTSGGNEAAVQERLLQALSEIVRAKNIVLVFSNIDQLTGGAADLLADFLGRGTTFAIATTSARAYAERLEQSGLGQAFEKINVSEPETREAIHVVESKVGEIEYEKKVIFSYDAVEKSVLLSDRYMHELFLPQKAVEVCEEAALAVAKARGEHTMVVGEDIAKIVADKTGVPLTSVSQSETDVLLHLEERMKGRLIGQEEAVSAVAAALRRGRAGLRSQNRPMANFLFLGPTGVGKTELAKTVASVFFGDEEAMLRFDMSEYQDKSSIHRLIGVPVSHEGGLMTEAVRKTPFAIILLDEIEKAHPDILNVFLQVFDDGRLTDAQGRTVDFTNAVIVATSNAGAQFIQDAVIQNRPLAEIKTRLLEQELRGIYRPELLNRFDAVIVFKPLTLEDVSKIAALMIQQTAKRLDAKGIHFRAEPEAVQELAQAGFDPKFGARPLRRVVQDRVDNAIATALLEGKVQRRDTILLKAGGAIEIEKAPAL